MSEEENKYEDTAFLDNVVNNVKEEIEKLNYQREIVSQVINDLQSHTEEYHRSQLVYHEQLKHNLLMEIKSLEEEKMNMEKMLLRLVL